MSQLGMRHAVAKRSKKWGGRLALCAGLLLSGTAHAAKEAPFDMEGMYQYLMGEIALQRGDPLTALEIYAELIKNHHDARFARRGVELAVYAQKMPQAMAFAREWAALEPENQEVEQVLLDLLMRSPADIKQPTAIQAMMASESRRPDRMMYVAIHAPEVLNKADLQAFITTLTKPYLAEPEAMLAMAQAAASLGQTAEALTWTDRALKARADWVPAVMARAYLLAKTNPEQALVEVDGMVRRHPDEMAMRELQARLLVNNKRYQAALDAYSVLRKTSPSNPEFAYAQAALQAELKQNDLADKTLQEALLLGYREPDRVRMQLGELAAQRKDWVNVQRWFDAVEGEQFASAQARAAFILAGAQQLDLARSRLHAAAVIQPGVEGELIRVEAGLLLEYKHPDLAYAVLTAGVAKLPLDLDVRYDRAMQADRQGHPDIMEADLRAIIQKDAEHAAALNALGYALADRNEKLPEAAALLEKAIQLKPEDAAIMDSVGWVKYRQGQLTESLGYLQRAYSQQQDAEIAAHLGEVLWMLGRYEEARNAWKLGVKTAADNPVLQATMKRLDAK